MCHLTMIDLLSHIDGAVDILVKNNFNNDAEVLKILSRKYHIIYQLAARNSNGNS